MCQQGIVEAKIFVERQNKIRKDILNSCLIQTRNFSSSKDSAKKYFECYEEVISEIEKMERVIKNEFANYI